MTSLFIDFSHIGKCCNTYRYFCFKQTGALVLMFFILGFILLNQ